ncbi:MAG: DNA-binding transcriptional regulator KdgR [Vibrio sp.]|uniref:DNA-binding transcriptional regulator KdgR n=1 Tax=Vibrio sp. TaxID=678 RepID=UPI003A83A60C
MTEKATLPEQVSSVLKVFNILHALGENKKCGVSDLSQRLMMSKAKTIHFLETMMSLGYVTKEGEEYSLTLKLFELGAGPLEYINLEELADKEMVLISDAIGEAIHLGVLEGESFVHTHKIDAQYNLITHSDIGRPRPLYSTAIGKMLLSGLDDNAVKVLLKDVPFIKYTPNTMENVEQILAALAPIRSQHYSESMEEQEPGIRCLAAPIYDRMGNIIAGLSISTPTIRYNETRKTECIQLLHGACQRISAQLGFHKYPVAVMQAEVI